MSEVLWPTKSSTCSRLGDNRYNQTPIKQEKMVEYPYVLQGEP